MKSIITHKLTKVLLHDFGEVEIDHLAKYTAADIDQVFDLIMRITAYWKVVIRRLIDTALHLQFTVNSLVNKDLEQAIINNLKAVCWNLLQFLGRGTELTRD